MLKVVIFLMIDSNFVIYNIHASKKSFLLLKIQGIDYRCLDCIFCPCFTGVDGHVFLRGGRLTTPGGGTHWLED